MTEDELTTISFKVPAALRDRLQEAADSEHRTLSNYLRVTLDTTVPPLPDEKKKEATR